MKRDGRSIHRFGSNPSLSGVGRSSDFPGYSQGVGATVLVLCDSRTVLCSISTLRFFQSCVIPLVWFWWFCKQILADISVQECCVYVNCNCDVVRLWMVFSVV